MKGSFCEGADNTKETIQAPGELDGKGFVVPFKRMMHGLLYTTLIEMGLKTAERSAQRKGLLFMPLSEYVLQIFYTAGVMQLTLTNN